MRLTTPIPSNLSMYFSPPGRAVKPVSLDAPSLGDAQWEVPDSFNLPPAIFSPPRKSLSVFHSSKEGTCQPDGNSYDYH